MWLIFSLRIHRCLLSQVLTSTSTFFSARYCILSTLSLYCCMELFYCSCMTLHLPFKSSASFFLQAFRDQLSDRQPCPPAYQPVPCNLMPYIMSYSQERVFILNGGRKFIHLHTDFWHSLCLQTFPFIFRSVFSFSKIRQAVKTFVLYDSLFSDIVSLHASL